jgi:hypothetical protein
MCPNTPLRSDSHLPVDTDKIVRGSKLLGELRDKHVPGHQDLVALPPQMHQKAQFPRRPAWGRATLSIEM